MNGAFKKYNKRQDCHINLALTDSKTPNDHNSFNETFITDTDDDDKSDVMEQESSILTMRNYQQREEITPDWNDDNLSSTDSITTMNDDYDDDDDDDNEHISDSLRSRRSISTPNDDGRIKELLIMSIKHKYIAEQLTVIMHDIYVNIPFHRTDHMDTIDNNYYTDSYTKIFNQIVRWIQYSILVAVNSKQRAKIIKKWIKTCDHLLILRNFHGLVAIHCGLMSNCVYSGKLKIAWFKYKNIIKKKHHDKLAQIGEIVSYNDNFKILRDKISDAPSPILPFWGIFKRDIQFSRESKNGEMIINGLMQQYEKYKYGEYSNLKRDKLIETWIHHKLNETSMITIQAMNRMSDNVRVLDETIREKRRHSLMGRISQLK